MVFSTWVTDKHCHVTRNKYWKSEDFSEVRTNRKPMSPNIQVIQQEARIPNFKLHTLEKTEHDM